MKLEDALRIYLLHKHKQPVEEEDTVTARMSATVVALGDAVVELQATLSSMAEEAEWVGVRLDAGNPDHRRNHG